MYILFSVHNLLYFFFILHERLPFDALKTGFIPSFVGCLADLRFLFDGFTPLSIHVAVESLEPMRVKHTRQRSQIEPRWQNMVHFLGGVGAGISFSILIHFSCLLVHETRS